MKATMTRKTQFDLIIIGGGIAAAATALAAARPSGPKPKSPSICWVQTDTRQAADTTAANYAVLNPLAGRLLPVMKTRLAMLTDGSFRGMDIVTASDGRRATFTARSLAGYVCDGPKLLKGLTALCQQAKVTIVRPAGAASFAANDHTVRAAWAGGQVEASLALLADPQPIIAGQTERLGFRRQWLAGRMYQCVGQTFAISPAELNAAFGRVRRMFTIWQLESLDGKLSVLNAAGAHDGHAWLLPKRNSLSVAFMLREPLSDQPVPLNLAELMDSVLAELRQAGALPVEVGPPVSPVQTWQLPVAAAVDIESHVGKRSLAVGLAGGFVSALSGQWLHPVIHAAVLAAGIVSKALADPRPQDALTQFAPRWRQKLADYLRSPNTRLAFLLPLVFSNQQIADRFARAYLFGENF